MHATLQPEYESNWQFQLNDVSSDNVLYGRPFVY